jgi:CheY-like chemotaxis protein
MAVDDDPISLEIISILLESEGHRGILAESGERALEILGEFAEGERPEIILADLQMPGICGPQLAGWLRRAAPNALLIALSATPPESVEGYDAVLKKPLSPGWVKKVQGNSHPAGGVRDASTIPAIDDRVFGALRRAMATEALREVCEAFFADSRSRIVEIRRMAEAGDFDAVRRLAHTLKGSASMIGASRLAGEASAIEAGGYKSSGDLLKMIEDLAVQSRTVESMLLGTI